MLVCLELADAIHDIGAGRDNRAVTLFAVPQGFCHFTAYARNLKVRVHAREHLTGAEGFDKIVIGAGVQP
jgi:hypothetical protein